MKYGNIFARELEDVLTDHELRLSQLDDRTSIHREKVRRLRKSLEASSHFPVLNPEEMDEVITVVRLDSYEVLRLRAAIITASIQATLASRIGAENAFIAVEQIFPIIVDSMEQYKGAKKGLAAMRGDNDHLYEETEEEQALEPALWAFDSATRMLHEDHEGETGAEQLEWLQQAAAGFEKAHTLLAALADSVKASEAWHFWHTEVQSGVLTTRQRIMALEQHP